MKEVCLECGSERLQEEVKEQQFPYGIDSRSRVILTARMPVFTCLDCGHEFFDGRGESARQNAVNKYLGVSTTCDHDFEWINPTVDGKDSNDEVLACLICGYIKAAVRDFQSNQPS